MLLQVFRASAFVFLLVLLASCTNQQEDQPAEVVEQREPIALKTGAERLLESGFAEMQGMTLGLVVNHTARVDSLHLGDIVQQVEGVTLGAFYSPEHGIRGDADAGAEIADGIDQKTGVPVYSIYGKTRKPTQESLEGIDALVYDIQDIGSRFYTYISTLGYAMQAAAEAGIPFYVLDRPNPLNGQYVSGFVRREGYASFVGLYPIPVVHGLTVGELAQLIKGEALLEGLENLDLRIIEMEGWDRATRWPALNRTWRPTSPNIPDFETALIYPGTCYFEAVEASEGRGTYTPFKHVGAAWADGEALAATLNAYNLPGVRFSSTSFTPRSIEGMSSNPPFKDELQQGVEIEVTDIDAFEPVEVGMYIVHAFYQQAPADKKGAFINERWMGLLAGTDVMQKMLEAGNGPDEIVAAWQEEVAAFKQLRSAYLLY